MGRAAAQECPSAFWQHWQAPFFVFNSPPFARKSRSWKKTIASGSSETSLTSSRKTKKTRSCGSPQTKLGTKAVVPGAQATITGPIGSLTQTTTEEGSFLFSTLIPGMYSIKVQKSGFKVANIKSAEVLINKTTSVEVILEAGEITQTVEVSAASVTVDTSSSAVTANIADTFFENIPVQRGVSSLFYLSPGAVDGIQTGSNNPSISGSSGLEYSYVADGVSINDPAFGGLGVWARSYG